MEKQRESSRARRIRRTKLDWFGIIMMFVLLVCSLAIFARLMATKMLTTTNMVLIMVALLVVNGLHIFVQPFAVYSILFYIAYMEQFMLSALEDTLVKLIHKWIFF